jgi:hypothetical protein
MKLSIQVTGFKRFEKGTLVGFCEIIIRELRLKVHEVAVHEKGDARWAAMPARPWIRDGALVLGDNGKAQYSPLFEFETREVRDAFSAAVWRALLAFEPTVSS